MFALLSFWFPNTYVQVVSCFRYKLQWITKKAKNLLYNLSIRNAHLVNPILRILCSFPTMQANPYINRNIRKRLQFRSLWNFNQNFTFLYFWFVVFSTFCRECWLISLKSGWSPRWEFPTICNEENSTLYHYIRKLRNTISISKKW